MNSIKLISVMASALFLFSVAILLRSSQIYFMCAVLVSLPLISWILGKLSIRELEITRDIPTSVFTDETVEVRLWLRTKGKYMGSFQVQDKLPDNVRMIGRPSYAVENANESVCTYTLEFARRGEYEVGPALFHISDPIGFFSFVRHNRSQSTVTVLPRPLKIPELSSSQEGGAGDRDFDGCRTKGDGTTFRGIREYTPGDDLRRIHWRSAAKLGKLNVMEYEQSSAKSTVIALDLHKGSELGSAPRTSLDYAAGIAAAIAEDSILCGTTVHLIGLSLENPATRPEYGQDHLQIILHALASVQADRKESFSHLIMQSAQQIEDNCRLICLTTALDPGLVDCASLLACRGVNMQVLLLSLDSRVPTGAHALATEIESAGGSMLLINCLALSGMPVADYSNAA
jgi:uncharacterized protein (DUF58 family)